MGKDGVQDDVTKLEGREFNIVKKGLDKAQVADFIKELIGERNMLLQREEHISSLTKLAERTVIEADELTKEIKKEAIEQAKAKAAIEADKIIEETKRKAIEQAKSETEAIIAKAEEQTQEHTQRIYGQLLSQLESLKQQVVVLEGESSQSTDKIKVAATEKELPSTQVPAALLQEIDITPGANPEVSLESTDDKDTESQELFQVIDLATGIELQEKVPVSADNQDTATYKKEVELEILPPINPLKLMEIMQYLDNLPEIESTELIPKTDKPLIIVLQRKPIRLVDTLRKLPQVEDVRAEGRQGKIEITLSSTNVAAH